LDGGWSESSLLCLREYGGQCIKDDICRNADSCGVLNVGWEMEEQSTDLCRRDCRKELVLAAVLEVTV